MRHGRHELYQLDNHVNFLWLYGEAASLLRSMQHFATRVGRTMSSISKDVQFSELMNQLRHLGAIRFVMMGVCAALTVGVLTAHYSLIGLGVEKAAYTRFVGTAVVVLFALFELYASCHYKRFADRAISLEGSDGAVFNSKKVRVLGPVTLTSLAIYTLILLIWWGTP